MKFQYASDLHLEFQDNYIHLKELDWLRPVAPYLILAGDIDVISSGTVTRSDFFQYISKHWQQVFIIPGNHEWYQGGDVSTAFDLELDVLHNVKYLNHRSLVVEGVELLFTTLWSHTDAPLIQDWISDFRTCKYENEGYTYMHHDELHRRAVEWLNQELLKEKTYPRVVVSHFVPCKEVDDYPSTDDWQGDVIKRYFVADLSQHLAEWNIDYWVYGHNHWDKDTEIFGIKFRSNQFGYCQRMEHTKFVFDKVVEV